ncbi:MAG TPA: DUF3300 domain-containing protein [Xanthobacteraceae bacterium]
MPTLSPSLRALTACAASFILLTAGTPSALAQGAQPVAQQQPAAQPLSAQQIDQLVAPIALYPDDLLGQILTACTYPLEAVLAARWSAANPNVKGPQLEAAMQQQPWDPSIKALAAVPQVLAMMSDKLDWTQSLGDAYLSQPDDVAAAIQRLRLKAQAAGHLQASSQQRIRRVPAPQPIIIDGRPEPEYIVIEPVDPGVLYVPIYDPYVIYGAWPYPVYRPFYWYPPGYVAVGVIGFGTPFVVGAALWAHYNWESRHVDINVVNYNKFNHTNIVNQTWEHNPLHRGNIPYNNAALQQKFGKAATSNANVTPLLQKPNTGATLPNNLKGATTPINSNAISNLERTDTGNKKPDLKIGKGTDLKVDKGANIKVDKNTKGNVNGNLINNTDKPRTLDRRANITTDTRIKSNPVGNNAVRNVTVQNVQRNVQAPNGGGGGGNNIGKKKKPFGAQ